MSQGLPLYLIAHKVRGEPAFDIAQQMEMEDDEIWWILPSTGHRAYPYAYWLLEDLFDGSDYPHVRPFHVADPPADLPDFFRQPSTPVRDPSTALAEGRSILESLGLAQPFKRRV